MTIHRSFWCGLPAPGAQVQCCFPPVLQAAIYEAEQNIQAPRQLIVASALSAISVVVQGLVDIRKPTGQIVPTSLMLLVIADSGERKTGTESAFQSSIRAFQERRACAYQVAKEGWAVKHAVWEAKKKSILSGIKVSAEEGLSSEYDELRLLAHERNKPAKPKLFKLLYEDATPEALFHGLHQDLSTAGLISSEGGAILSGRAFKDLAKHNSIWSGSSVTVDRRSGESFELNGARLTVSILAQDSAMRAYMERFGEVSRGAGLWARFLVCKPASTQGGRRLQSGVQFWSECDKFAGRLTELLEMNAERLDAGVLNERTVIEFTAEAGERWVLIANAIEAEICIGGRFEGAGDHASKLAENIARVAALLHVFEGGRGGISLELLEAAVGYCLYCSDEFMRLFMPMPQDQADALELSVWLGNLRNAGQRFVRKNYVRQFCLNKLREKGRLDRALEVLRLRGEISFLLLGKTLCLDLLPFSLVDAGRAQVEIFGGANKALV